MFENFFNRLYYGDPHKPDLKKEDIPDSPFRLFFDVLKVRFWKLIQANLLYILFWIPGLLLTILYLYAYNEVFMANNSVAPEPGFFLMYFMLLIPCLLFAGPATAGIIYVLRNWARDENAWLWSDFKDTLKKNWKPSLAIMLLNGLGLLVFYFDTLIYAEMAKDSFIFMIPNYFILGSGFIYAMMNMFIFPMLITYKLNIRQILKNSFIFTIVELPRTVGIFILTTGLFFLIFYLSLFTAFVPILLVGFTFPLFIAVSYTNWVFNKYFHSKRQKGRK